MDDMGYIEEYSLDEQIEDLAKVTGLGKHVIRRVLKYQRRFAQEKMYLGYAYNLKGIVKISPKQKGDGYVLSASVAQSVPRPGVIRRREFFKNKDDEIRENMIEDEDLE